MPQTWQADAEIDEQFEQTWASSTIVVPHRVQNIF